MRLCAGADALAGLLHKMTEAGESLPCMMKMRTIIIGDIHGCSNSFGSLLEELQPNPVSDRIVLLGDLFDRGPDSWEVLQQAKELAGKFGENLILLRGNHEDYLLQPKLSFSQRLVWERVGRKTTVRSFQKHREKMEDAAPWLTENCRLFWKGEGFQCVHAGIKIDPLELNDTYTMIHDHDIVLRNHYAGPLTITGHIALEEPFWFTGDGERIIPLKEGERKPLPETGVICIDTGCGKGGRLTAMVVEAGEYVLHSVPEA